MDRGQRATETRETLTRERPRPEIGKLRPKRDQDQREAETKERRGSERDRDQREIKTREGPTPERERDLDQREFETRERETEIRKCIFILVIKSRQRSWGNL